MNNPILSTLPDIVGDCKGILLDAYGVFWAGNQKGLISGAKEAMEQLVHLGKKVGILSNSTQLVAKELDKFHSHGLFQEKHFHFILTSGELAKQVFSEEKFPFPTPAKKYWLLGHPHPKYSSPHALFKNSPFIATPHLSEADFIYISIPHINGEDQTDPDVFMQEIIKVKESKLPMVCANPDAFAHEGRPPVAVVRQGSIAKLYESIGGKVFYIGKPAKYAFERALEAFKSHHIHHPEEILMIGDTPETDIRGAKLVKMRSALVTSTGIMAEKVQNKGLLHTLQEIATQDYPDFLIEKLEY